MEASSAYPESSHYSDSLKDSSSTYSGSDSDYAVPGDWEATSSLRQRRVKARGLSSIHVPTPEEWHSDSDSSGFSKFPTDNPVAFDSSLRSTGIVMDSSLPSNPWPDLPYTYQRPSKGSPYLAYFGSSPYPSSSPSSGGSNSPNSDSPSVFGPYQDTFLNEMQRLIQSAADADPEGCSDPLALPSFELQARAFRLMEKHRRARLKRDSRPQKRSSSPSRLPRAVCGASYFSPSSPGKHSAFLSGQNMTAIDRNDTAQVRPSTHSPPSSKSASSTSRVARIQHRTVLHLKSEQSMGICLMLISIILTLVLPYRISSPASHGSPKVISYMSDDSMSELALAPNSYHVESVIADRFRLPGQEVPRLTIDPPSPNVSVDKPPDPVMTELTVESFSTLTNVSTETFCLDSKVESAAQTSFPKKLASESQPPHVAVPTAAPLIPPQIDSIPSESANPLEDVANIFSSPVNRNEAADGGFVASLRTRLWRNHMKVLHNARRSRKVAISKIMRSSQR